MFKKNYINYINPELSKYIKEQNNKLIKKYSNNYNCQNNIGQCLDVLVKRKKNNFNNFNNSPFFLILLTTFVTFLAGYNSSILIK